jgi:hypothetical protein
VLRWHVLQCGLCVRHERRDANLRVRNHWNGLLRSNRRRRPNLRGVSDVRGE